MNKILVVGEHWANASGFARLHKYIIESLCDSKLFSEVTSIAILGRQGLGAPDDFIRTDVIMINSVDYLKSNTNQFGRDSICKFLLSNKDYNHILCLGDPWYYEAIPFIKNIVGNKVKFHYYCPIEGSNLPSLVNQHVADLGYPDPTSTNISKILNSFDQIIPYTFSGKQVIQKLCTSDITNPIYHWIRIDSIIKYEEIPAIEKAIANKHVIGFIGRNVHRKGTDLLLELATLIPDNCVILAHTPKTDPYGWNFNNIQHYYEDQIWKKIIFTEDYIPGLFLRTENNMVVRDVKNGLSQPQLEWLYSKMNIFINLSRAEGFGYPIIEAMVRGIPTLVSRYSGPGEIMKFIKCEDMSVPTLGIKEIYPVGCWYQMETPNINEFAIKIISLFNNLETLETIGKRQKDEARKLFLEELSEHRKELPNMLVNYEFKNSNLNHNAIVIDSYLEKCGIATYTSNIIGDDYPRRIKEYSINKLKSSIDNITKEIIHLQYEPALWSKQMIEILKDIKNNNNKLVITMHTYLKEFIDDIAKYSDWFIFHSLNNEQHDHIHSIITKYPHLRYTIRNHAIPEYNISTLERLQIRERFGYTDDHIVIVLNGFILPYKKIAEQAASTIEHIRNNPDRFRLLIVGSKHEKDYLNNGQKILNSIIEYAKSRNVEKHVTVIYKFMPSREMALHLSAADYGLLYHNNGLVGSQSGSVRELLAARVIPIVTRSKTQQMHNDIIEAKAAIGIQGKDMEALGPNQFASGGLRVLDELFKNPANISILKDNIKSYCNEHSFTQFRKFLNTVYMTLKEEIGD